MPDYSAVTDVGVSPRRLFEYLSDVDNLPSYFDRMRSAESTGGEEVHTTADLGDRQVEADAWFRVDADNLRLAWGSEGESDYHGTLQVTGDGDVSSVSVTLHTEHAAGDEIQAGLEQTLANIRRNVEGAPA
jgi:hypothetical protein